MREDDEVEAVINSMFRAEWLRATEQKYGGRHAVKRSKVSPHDPRTPEELARGHMVGGDRMTDHGYAEHYARELAPFVARDRAGETLTIVELGILRGVGLAIWCDLFPRARVIGLDVDPSAFVPIPANDRAYRFEFDELATNNAAAIRKILRRGSRYRGEKIDIFFDDAIHTDEAILKTFGDFLPFMAKSFGYFVEDNATVHRGLRNYLDTVRDISVRSFGELTVVTR